MNKVIFWDFDGTLTYRPRMFSGSLRMVLDEHVSGHGLTDESFSQGLQTGFQWHEPDKEYLHSREPEAWWSRLYPVFERAYCMNGIEAAKASFYAKEARKYLADPKYFSLYDDTQETLEYFKVKGYRNIILSNHIPELQDIVDALGLMEHVEGCINSARVGYEKPNPGIFRLGMELAGNPEEVWMVGDNLKADIRGAEAVGINAILVRKPVGEPVKYFSPDLKGVLDIIDK